MKERSGLANGSLFPELLNFNTGINRSVFFIIEQKVLNCKVFIEGGLSPVATIDQV
jgi:hypothetical protein